MIPHRPHRFHSGHASAYTSIARMIRPPTPAAPHDPISIFDHCQPLPKADCLSVWAKDLPNRFFCPLRWCLTASLPYCSLPAPFFLTYLYSPACSLPSPCSCRCPHPADGNLDGQSAVCHKPQGTGELEEEHVCFVLCNAGGIGLADIGLVFLDHVACSRPFEFHILYA